MGREENHGRRAYEGMKAHPPLRAVWVEARGEGRRRRGLRQEESRRLEGLAAAAESGREGIRPHLLRRSDDEPRHGGDGDKEEEKARCRLTQTWRLWRGQERGRGVVFLGRGSAAEAFLDKSEEGTVRLSVTVRLGHEGLRREGGKGVETDLWGHGGKEEGHVHLGRMRSPC